MAHQTLRFSSSEREAWAGLVEGRQTAFIEPKGLTKRGLTSFRYNR